MNSIRVMIADDDEMIREGLRTVLEISGPPLEVIGSAADGEEAIDLAAQARPDVVLMDLRMPGKDGIEATRVILSAIPGCKVLVLTTFDDDELIYGALEAGARGYMLKGVGREELAQAIKAVAQGAVLMSPGIAQRLLLQRTVRIPRGEAHEQLTERELEILRLLALRLSNGAIAKKLFLSEGTVKNYVSKIYERLGVTDRVQAILYAREHGLD